MSIPQKNEASLLKKAKNGDKDAFNLMVIKYQPRIMSVLHGFLKTHSDAEDLTQQTFIKAWTNLDKFRGESSFYTWIYRIAINLAKNFVKKPSTQIEKTSLLWDECGGVSRRMPDRRASQWCAAARVFILSGQSGEGWRNLPYLRIQGEAGAGSNSQ